MMPRDSHFSDSCSPTLLFFQSGIRLRYISKKKHSLIGIYYSCYFLKDFTLKMKGLKKNRVLYLKSILNYHLKTLDTFLSLGYTLNSAATLSKIKISVSIFHKRNKFLNLVKLNKIGFSNWLDTNSTLFYLIYSID